MHQNLIAGAGKGSSRLLQSRKVLGDKLFLLGVLGAFSRVQTQPSLYHVDCRGKDDAVPAR